ncbi:MAG TPA: hypothetical protein VFG73_02725 [Rhodanobacteraceae bacterium]|nr:hypothetical protein [Rhodanobacteraceae bacterium]
MKALTFATRAMLVATALTFAAAAQAGPPITFNFTFEAPAPSTAKAIGQITFADRDLLENPGDNGVDLPDPSVTALTVTVSGASAGNGTFGLSDFEEINFEIPDPGLDLDAQLVGQPTVGSAWGTPGGCGGSVDGPGDAGDFNMFIENSAAPEGVDCFALGAGGGDGEVMFLTSMIAAAAPPPPAAASVPVPVDSRWALLALALLLGLGATTGLRRYIRFR